MPGSQTPQQNHLLAALSDLDRARLLPQLQLVSMSFDQVLYEPDEVRRHVYFPLDCIVSLLNLMKCGASTAISVVGNEGLVGTSLLMGSETAPTRAIVQSAGQAYRLSGPHLKEALYHSSELQQLLLRYVQALITQTAQTVVCNRHHTMEQRLCRWLLLMADRRADNPLVLTHEQIADRLGVRREGISEAAGKLQKAGAINYNRGQITLLNRPMLEALCCECYAVVKRECDRLVPPPRPARE